MTFSTVSQTVLFPDLFDKPSLARSTAHQFRRGRRLDLDHGVLLLLVFYHGGLTLDIDASWAAAAISMIAVDLPRGLRLRRPLERRTQVERSPRHDHLVRAASGRRPSVVEPDHQRHGDTIVFPDDSRIVLVPVRRPHGRGYLVMLPTPEADTPSATAPPTAGGRQTPSALPHRSLQHGS